MDTAEEREGSIVYVPFRTTSLSPTGFLQVPCVLVVAVGDALIVVPGHAGLWMSSNGHFDDWREFESGVCRKQ